MSTSLFGGETIGRCVGVPTTKGVSEIDVGHYEVFVGLFQSVHDPFKIAGVNTADMAFQISDFLNGPVSSPI